ncbi:MAG: hypothetical protein GWO24_07625, partial [Akkermansiaceae bacterium]|nr:hypothetical protein [Akkermansiaceae bacterium]
MLEIAQRLGGAVSEAFPWRSFREALFERVKGIHEAQEGSIAAESSSRFLRQLFRTGFWNHPDYRYEQWKNVLRTPSGR